MVKRSRRVAGAWLLALFAPVACARHVAPAAGPGVPDARPIEAPATAAPPDRAPAPAALPERLTDVEFWTLITGLSEPGGSFRSDNLLSNELFLQYVIPELVNVARPGRVYMGVGPEQNFTYIAALKPALAVIVDVRRGNLDMHLMYKAIFEMSRDRSEFVSRLFSRKRPDGLDAATGVREMFQAFSTVPADETLFEQNFTAIIDRLQKTHGFPIEPEDRTGIRYIYEYFGRYGPELTYWMSGGGGPGRGGFRNSPTYADLMVATDGAGLLRSYLASEETFTTLKTLQSKNLLVPIVGNFAGPKAIRAVGAWLKAHNAHVAAFYLSNVEQYLNMDGIWMDFCANAAQLPIDETSQFIRSYRGGGGPGFGGGASLSQGTYPMIADLKACGTLGGSW